VGVYLLPEVPMKQSEELVFQSRPSGLSGVGEEVKPMEQSILDTNAGKQLF